LERGALGLTGRVDLPTDFDLAKVCTRAAAIGVAVLNRMLAAGRPNSVRTARNAN